MQYLSWPVVVYLKCRVHVAEAESLDTKLYSGIFLTHYVRKREEFLDAMYGCIIEIGLNEKIEIVWAKLKKEKV